MRWWKLAGVAVAGLFTLVAATWAVFWIRPPDPAHLITLVASYDNTLAVPPNPYGKASANELADLTKPGGWLGTQSRIRGSTKPTRFTRIGLPDLSSIREKCIVVTIAAHGGRDRDGAFLFSEDATDDPDARVRLKAILDQLANLPAQKQKLLILDATEPPAYTDLGLVHNDFAGAVEELDDAIAAVPNLAVFMSSGTDQRSWVSPEWGQTSFLYHVLNGLRGAADVNGDKRITGGELVDYVSLRVQDWVRDHRGALQTPVLLPKGQEGKQRVEAMHLAMTEGPPPQDATSPPFDRPPELKQVWLEYLELAEAYLPPTAYTPHLWRQYEAWTLRFEQAIIAGDGEGAKNARSKASDLKREIEAARRLDIGPQTLALPAGLGGLPAYVTVPEQFRQEIEHLGKIPAVERPAAWAKVRTIERSDPDVSRLLWCWALIEWVASDPLTYLPAVPSLVPLVTEGMSIRPAEINFLLMLAQNLPPTDKTELIGPLLKRVLLLRLNAEQTAGLTADGKYSFPEWLGLYGLGNLHAADKARRNAEDLCFANSPEHWQEASDNVNAAVKAYAARVTAAKVIYDLIGPWHRSTAGLPGFSEWLARGMATTSLERLSRELLFQAWRAVWGNSHAIAAAMPLLITGPHRDELARARINASYAAGGMQLLNDHLAGRIKELLVKKREFDSRPTPRSALVNWWQSTSDVLTAPIPTGVELTPPMLNEKEVRAAQRVELVQEFRRVSQQLLVTGKSRTETLPDVTPEATREQAFGAARRRGLLLLDRLKVIDTLLLETPRLPGFPEHLVNPGEKPETPEFRFNHFAFQADARQSLAKACSRCGELLKEAVKSARETDDRVAAERWLRIVPAYAEVSDGSIGQLRRERVQSVLAEQANRTYLDYWFGEGGTRYYRTAIEYLLADAQKLGPNPPQDPFKTNPRRKESFPVTVTAPARFAITDEPDPKLKITLKREPALDIDGVPMFWVTPDLKSKTREALKLDAKTAATTLIRPINRPTTPLPRFPVVESTPVQIVGFFRGRMIERPVPVDIYRVPDRMAATAPSLASTAIAVRADPDIRARYGFGTGTVSVVLDCSGSLGPDDRRHPKDIGLYPTALEALDILLNSLPPGTVLNVWTFGQKMPEANSPEDTIHEILKPTPLPKNAKERDALIETINKEASIQEPWDLSPIVRAALKARDRIREEPGPFKTVVLITDGVDTRFDGDQKNLKKRSVKDAIRAEFSNGDVRLAIVALPVPKSELLFQAEFTVVNELKPSGKFVPIPKGPKELVQKRMEELTDWLRSGLNPRVRFTLEPLDGQNSQGDLTAGTDTADNWYTGRLEPGTYRFNMTGVTEASRTVQLNRGDRLLLDLTENRGEIDLRRHWFADTAMGQKSGRPTDPWRLSLLQNRSEAGGLRLFTTIEDRPKPTDPLSVARIGDVWFEVRPVLTNPGPISLRWRTAPGYPAPSWSLDAPGWPVFPGGKAGASPLLEAWWSPGGPFPARGAWMAPTGMPITTLNGASATIGDTPLTLDSIGFEQQMIDGLPEPQRCLVARLSHPPGNPVWVRPLGATAARTEIRIYRGANKVTCLFWAINDAKITGFDVVVLNEALQRAKELGYNAILDTIPGPTDTSPRPEPPVELR